MDPFRFLIYMQEKKRAKKQWEAEQQRKQMRWLDERSRWGQEQAARLQGLTLKETAEKRAKAQEAREAEQFQRYMERPVYPENMPAQQRITYPIQILKALGATSQGPIVSGTGLRPSDYENLSIRRVAPSYHDIEQMQKLQPGSPIKDISLKARGLYGGEGPLDPTQKYREAEELRGLKEQFPGDVIDLEKTYGIYQKPSKTLIEIEEEAKARAKGTAAGTPPKVLTPPKTLSDIEAEAAARARGTASVKGPIPNQNQKELNAIRTDYFQALDDAKQQMSQYRNLKARVNIVSEAMGQQSDPMAEDARQSAESTRKRALTLGKQYVARGGRWKDLGVDISNKEAEQIELTWGDSSPENVKEAYKKGILKENEAIKILQFLFGFE